MSYAMAAWTLNRESYLTPAKPIAKLTAESKNALSIQLIHWHQRLIEIKGCGI